MDTLPLFGSAVVVIPLGKTRLDFMDTLNTFSQTGLNALASVKLNMLLK